MNNKNNRAMAIGVLSVLSAAALIAAAYSDGFSGALDPAWLLQQPGRFAEIHRSYPIAVTCGFFVAYVLIAALALPGASVLMLAAGASHGLIAGTLLCLSACTCGATLTMLASRHLFRGAVARRYRSRIDEIDSALAREGALYLFSLRMLPVIPFAMVNLLSGVTAMRTWTFFWVSFVGMLAATAVYVNAGRELARIDSVSALFSPGMLAALAAIGAFPLLSKRLIDRWRMRRTARA